MKRIFALLLIFIFIFSLSSCVAKPTEIPTNAPEPEEIIVDEIEEISEKEPLKVGVFWYDFADAFHSTIRDALDSELNDLGIEYENYDAAKTQAIQNDQIDSAIANGANLLIVNIVDTAAIEAAQAIVDKAKAADIPVIFFHRTIDDRVINSYENACMVIHRSGDIGMEQGLMAGQYIIENYDVVDRNGDGKISYIQMQCTPGHPDSEARTQYSVEYCNNELTNAGKPELEFYDPYNSNKAMWTGEDNSEACRYMEEALSTNPIDSDDPVELVFCNHDHLSLGVIEALNNIGYNTGDGDFIPVFGLDGSYPELIETGKLTGTVERNPKGIAKTIAILIENLLNGNNLTYNIYEQFNVYEEAPIIFVPYVTIFS